MILPFFATRFRRSCVPVLAVFGLFVLRASAHLGVSPTLGLEELARRSDLVCKATVLADHAVTDDSFTWQLGFEVHETSLRVVSIVKGSSPDVIRFRHYLRNSEPVWYTRRPYTFDPGRSYLIFATRIEGDTYRPFEQYQGMINEGVLCSGGTAPTSTRRRRSSGWPAWAKVTFPESAHAGGSRARRLRQARKSCFRPPKWERHPICGQ
jgi:hypothetical protein